MTMKMMLLDDIGARPMRAFFLLSFGLLLLAAISSCGDDTVAADCPQGQEKCGDDCVLVKLDPDNCGACGVACAADEVCSKGACADACGGGTENCGGICADTQIQPTNCGSCDTACDPGEYCVAGACVATCAVGTGPCQGTCIDMQSDVEHCGDCGNACQMGEVCSAGVCTCPNMLTVCDGACVDTQADVSHCGSCGNTCLASEVCVGGTCQCPAGMDLCSDECVDLQTDAAHCNGCGNTCGPNGVCDMGTCDCIPGLLRCGSLCIDPLTDNNHCGVCGEQCDGGRSCVNGTCECPPGETYCDNLCRDTQNDVNYCGNCTTICNSGQGCVDGSCTVPMTCQEVALVLPNGCNAFPLSTAQCGAETLLSSTPFDATGFTGLISHLPATPFAVNERARYHGTVSAPMACCGGSNLSSRIKNDIDQILTSANLIGPNNSSSNPFDISHYPSIRSCGHPHLFEMTANRIANFTSLVDRIGLNGNYNTGGVDLNNATVLALDPTTNETCDQVCGYLSDQCDDDTQFFTTTIPPMSTLAIEMAARSRSSLGANMSVRVHLPNGDFYCNAFGNKLLSNSDNFYTSRITNNTNTPQQIVLSPITGGAIHFNFAVAVEQ